MDADYSQIELRVLAHMSGDETTDRGVQRGTGYPQNHCITGIPHSI